jgi:hypothetical protein
MQESSEPVRDLDELVPGLAYLGAGLTKSMPDWLKARRFQFKACEGGQNSWEVGQNVRIAIPV